MIKVLIAEPQELIRQSLQIALNTKENIRVTDTVSDGREVLQSIEKVKPDVILMDIHMRKMDGVQCTKIIMENYSDIKIIILTTLDDDEIVFNAFKNGATGYLLKGVSVDDLEEAIQMVHAGKAMINLDIATKVVKLFNKLANNNLNISAEKKYVPHITKTEWKVIEQVGKGASNKEIAKILNLSEGTVRNYTSTVMGKLELRDRTQLAIWALQAGIIV